MPKQSMMKQSKLNAFFQVSRANLLLASIGHATLGMILAATTFSDLIGYEVLLYIFLHYSIALFGCTINTYFDYDVDKLYKKYMADSVDILGKRFMKVFIIGMGLVAFSLILFFFIQGFLLVALLASVGLSGALLYSAEPVRIKKHGLFSPIPVLILYTFPLFGGWFVVKNEVSLFFILFVIGYMLMNEGFTLVNTCEDYSEDKQQGIRTWAHMFGLKKTLTTAFIFSLSGLLCIAALAIPLIGSFSLNKIPAVISLLVTAFLIVKAGFEVKKTTYGSDLEQSAKRYGVRLQRWFLMTRYPLIVTSLLLLI